MAKLGDVIQLFATGLVSTPAGVLPTPQSVSGVTVTIGTTKVSASFAGLVAVGEFQINFTVPQLPDCVYPVSISCERSIITAEYNREYAKTVGDADSVVSECQLLFLIYFARFVSVDNE
jgi:hypothetical protein